MTEREIGFEESEAKAILQRAAALDARIVGRLTMEEMRAVAREAGSAIRRCRWLSKRHA